MSPKPMKPVDIYVRVSRVGGREHLISPAEQERRARALATEKGLTVGDVITDLDESGGKLNRPGLQQALDRVRDGRSGGLIVAWLDRLSRDSEHALRLLREISEAGGAVYAPDAPADMQTPEGELMTGITFAFAQYVRQRARAGFERAKANAIANGVPVNNVAPVGYRKGADRRLEPDPDVAPVIRDVFERRAVGAGPAALVRVLEDAGVRTSHGGHWSKQQVLRLLANPVYKGTLRYGRDDVERGVRAAPYVLNDAHPAIVPPSLWQAAQTGGARALPRNGDRSPFLLAGIIRCASCRYAMNGTTDGSGRRVYRCTRLHATGPCPAPVRALADDAEAFAVDAFWEHEAERAYVGEAVADAPDVDALRAAVDQARASLETYVSPEVQDAVGDVGVWSTGLRQRRERLQAAEAALGEAEAAAARTGAPTDVATLREVWADMPVQDRREVLAARFALVAAHPTDDGVAFVPWWAGSDVDLPRRGGRKLADGTAAPALPPLPFPAA